MSTTNTTTITGTTTTVVSYLRGTDHPQSPAYMVVERPARHDPRYRPGYCVVTVGLSTAWLRLSEPRPHGPETPCLCGEELDSHWGNPDDRGGHYREIIYDRSEESIDDLRAEIMTQLALHPYAVVWGCVTSPAEET